MLGHILHRNCLLKHVIMGKIEERINVTDEEEECKHLLDEDIGN
jgi:hypothetical protein